VRVCRWGRLTIGALGTVLLGACLPQTTGTVRTSQLPDYALASCEYIVEANFATCAQRARERRNGEIAMAVASYLAQKSDPAAALQWTEDAAAWGNGKALRAMYDSYYYGKAPLPADKDAAAKTLDAALAGGAQWARLLQASRLWTANAPEARTLITAAAEQNNCHAQAFLANAYYDGSLGEKNWTKAYFWLLLGQSGSTARLSEIHALTQVPAGIAPAAGFVTETCLPGRLPILKANMERALPARYIQQAAGAVTRWRPTTAEPDLAAPPDSAMIEPRPQPASASASRAPRMGTPAPAMPKWQLIAFDRTAAKADAQLAAADIFERASKHVWIIAVASEPRGTISQGSAVAIGPHRLITNCHIVQDARAIAIKQGKDIRSASLVSASPDTDRCILAVEKSLASYARTVRAFDSLKIGEAVVSIGSPHGLENTLGQGIVSGLRRADGMRVVQTTAPISPGSSGGGLFDASGNLVGITTFTLRDAEALNFAIAAEDFTQAK
jgi:serine protease Do